MSAAITSHINVAQLVLYAFWIFFAGLIIYLRREDKREGYPLESDRTERSPRVKMVGFPRPPEPKSYLLPLNQGVRQLPRPEVAPSPVHGATPAEPWPGAPLVPTGDPMRDGVGPASYPQRDDLPDLTYDGRAKVVPMRITDDFSPEPNDPDPRGMTVIAGDGRTVGSVVDVWVDRAEPRVLYFEVALNHGDDAEHGSSLGNNPLLPYGFANVSFRRKQIKVPSIMSHHWAHVPRTASNEQITRLEEDRIMAYFAGGILYAHPSRQDPLI